MKIAVIGANGQLGSDITKEFKLKGDDVIEINHSQIEVSNIDSVSDVMKKIKPDVIINTAAMHNVEKCEQDPALSFAVNGIGARNLALINSEMNNILIHISTDYVFDGLKNAPYVETDKTSALNVYGNTKVSGEQFIESIAKRYFIVRTSGIYGHNPCRAKGGLNFVELMLKLSKERPEIRVVDDEILTPTYTGDVAKQLVKLLQSSDFGLYHATAEGTCSWFEFAKKIFELTKSDVKLSKANPDEFPMKVKRPKYSVLENANLKKTGLNTFRLWSEALKNYIDGR